jgi:hypothetical protein
MPDTSHLVALAREAAEAWAWLSAGATMGLLLGCWLASARKADDYQRGRLAAYEEMARTRSRDADERLLAEVAAEFAENNRHL